MNTRKSPQLVRLDNNSVFKYRRSTNVCRTVGAWQALSKWHTSSHACAAGTAPRRSAGRSMHYWSVKSIDRIGPGLTRQAGGHRAPSSCPTNGGCAWTRRVMPLLSDAKSMRAGASRDSDPANAWLQLLAPKPMIPCWLLQSGGVYC